MACASRRELYDDQFGNATLPRRLETNPETPEAIALGDDDSGVARACHDRRWHRMFPVIASDHAGCAGKKHRRPSVRKFERGKSERVLQTVLQDEILTNLAKIADLKVISRTSVMQYKTGVARNLREIGQALGVAHLLEGSVQRAGGKVRVNAQLIDARTDAHLWAQTYDRDLADVFAIQSEIAKTIADQLQAKLSPSEKAAIEKPPTAILWPTIFMSEPTLFVKP